MATATRILVAVNEDGRRIGEGHHNAHIPDAVVDAIRDDHEDLGMGYIALSAKYGISKNTIRKIVTYERRAQTPVRWKRLLVHG